jgi:hypothetical protein
MRLAKALAILAASGALALPRGADAAEAGRGFELSVLVDGRIAPEYAFGGRLYVEALRGREFSLRLHNPTSERIAVALSVDGRNVIDAKRTTAGRASKWVLSPGETADIPGWQVSGETSRRFFFTDLSRSYARWLGDTSNTGVIEAVFFREREHERRAPSVTREDSSDRRPHDRAEEPVRVEGGVESGAAGGAPAAPLQAPADSRSQAGSARKEALKPAPGADELAATGIGERTDFRVNWVRFEEDPVPVGRVSLRYEYRSELVRLGVLPRDGNRSWRENSRGFEPDYAPDPYRTNGRTR